MVKFSLLKVANMHKEIKRRTEVRRVINLRGYSQGVKEEKLIKKCLLYLV